MVPIGKSAIENKDISEFYYNFLIKDAFSKKCALLQKVATEGDKSLVISHFAFRGHTLITLACFFDQVSTL